MEISQLRHLKRIILDQSDVYPPSQFALWLRSRLHQYLRFTIIPMNYGTSGKLVSAIPQSALRFIPMLSIPASVTVSLTTSITALLFVGGTAATATPQVLPGQHSAAQLDWENVSLTIDSNGSSVGSSSRSIADVMATLPHTPLNSATEWTVPTAPIAPISLHQKGTTSQKPVPVASVVFRTGELQEISPTTLPRLPQLNSLEALPNSSGSSSSGPSNPTSSSAATNTPAPNTPATNTPTASAANPNPSATTPTAQTQVTQATTVNSSNNANSGKNGTDTVTITQANTATTNPTKETSTPNTGQNTGQNPSATPTSTPTTRGNQVVNANIEPQTKVLVTPSARNPGLEPVRPLVVPTTPSEVRLERVQKITLQEAIELVGRTQRDIIQARIAVEKARGVVQEAEAAKNPTVSGNVTYNFNDSASTRLSNIANNLRSSTISQPLQGTVGVQYTLFDSGVNDTNIRIAVQTLRTAEADLNRVSQVAYLNVATAYYGLQNADGTVTIYEKQVENNERSLKDTQARERAGVGTKFDVLQSEVQLANARQDLLNAKVNQANARRELARLLSYVPTLDIAAADEIKPVDPWDKPIEETILLAVRNRSELDVRRLERDIARERANLSLARTGPQLSVFANYNLADDFNTIGGFAMGYQLGARLDFTLFDGGRAQAQVRQFKADQALAESRFEQDARQARFDVESSYNTMIGRRQQIDTAEKGLKQAEDALRLSRLRLSAGVGTQLEVISAENDLTRARVNRLQAITGYNQARANLERAINGMPNYQ